MKKLVTTICLILMTSNIFANIQSENVLEETLYQNFKFSLLSKNKTNMMTGFTAFEQKLLVDALWDISEEGDPSVLNAINDFNTAHYELIERLRLGILRIKFKRTTHLAQPLVDELMNELTKEKADTKIIYTIAAYEEDFLSAGHIELVEKAKLHPPYFDVALDQERKNDITEDLITDLFHKTPDVTTYMNGEYIKSVKIFMFCRENRLFPCLMVMKNVHGEVVRDEDGIIWSHKSLASSARGLPSYTRNGNTPTGILTIDSVMPAADQQISFGKFRRMILNFIPKSKNESLMKSLLPSSSHNQDWWKSSVTARDIGRNLFRIHGTGKLNQDPTVPYYPFMRTAGCIAQRENSYEGITYKDQRELLDAIMVAMNMEPNFENEIKVKGILYLVEIDDKNAPVELEDLAFRGIE
jgi:hypothetical protein